VNYLKKISKNTFFKIASLNGFAVAFKIGVGLISSKLLALFVGPSGMALVGNFRNFMTSVENVGTLGFQSGIVKYAAAYKNDHIQFQKLISTVFFIIGLTALVIGCVVYFTADYFNEIVMQDNQNFDIVFLVFGLSIPFYLFNFVILAFINGLEKFKQFIWIGITTTAIGLVTTLFFVIKLHTLGALLAMIVNPIILFGIGFYYLEKEIHFIESISIKNIDTKIISNLIGYSVMIILPAILSPIVSLAIRNEISMELGIEKAGFWETINRLATYYLMFINSFVGLYFFPKLSAATTHIEYRKLFQTYFKTIIPLFLIGAVVLYFGRFLVVQILFTKEFIPVTNLFGWQLIGDFFKSMALIMGTLLLAQKRVWMFMIVETISILLLYVLSMYLIQIYELQGIMIAQALENLFYLSILSVYYKKYVF
jgi:O-antigen/teichoic acid export membrane protein